jgi:glycosyltransferase involved in cell wall biosynthesis
MNKEKITIAIPTFNRSDLLIISLQSAIDQDWENFNIVVLDNASSDDTRDVVESFEDHRIKYVRNERNIGLFRNWNRAIEINKSPYLCILQDDDVLHPEFLSECCNALNRYPSAGFAFTSVSGIDFNGNELPIQNFSGAKGGKIDGRDYLHRIVAGEDVVIHSSSVLMRSKTLLDVGSFDIAHSKHSIDFNLYFRFAAKYDLVFVPKTLALIRRHAGADHVISTKGCGPLSMASERTDAVAYLLRTDRANTTEYRLWLAERLLCISMLRSQYASYLIPHLNLNWHEKLDLAKHEIESSIPRGARLILIDQNAMEPKNFKNHIVLPFAGPNGRFWGPPLDDETALRKIEAILKNKPDFLVFAWTAFWWFDHYKGLREYLLANFKCIVDNSRLRVFELF